MRGSGERNLLPRLFTECTIANLGAIYPFGVRFVVRDLLLLFLLVVRLQLRSVLRPLCSLRLVLPLGAQAFARTSSKARTSCRWIDDAGAPCRPRTCSSQVLASNGSRAHVPRPSLLPRHPFACPILTVLPPRWPYLVASKRIDRSVWISWHCSHHMSAHCSSDI